MKTALFLLVLALWPAFVVPDLSTLPLNRIQVIGSHNSYKQAIDPALFSLLTRTDSVRFKAIEYSHVSLTDQLNLGLQSLEIDIYADAKGGKYARPLGLNLAKGQQPYDSAGVMNEPGFKVLHIQDIDFRSHCPTFAGCLTELKRWSDAHPTHYPVFITMNAKDDTIKRPGFAIPEPFTASVYDELDKTIVDNLGRAKLITPDDVRGRAETLEKAVLTNKWPQAGWPTVSAMKGKFMFVLDETAPKRAVYIGGHPSLKNRVLFVNADAGTPEAAFLILNDPVSDEAQIRESVQKGYLVRTRADADTKQARTNDKRQFEAACRSGAQIISTDYYAKSTHFSSDYVIRFADGTYARPNPVLR